MIKRKRSTNIRCVPVAKGTGFPITVVCGFFGSGKTTLLRRWKANKSLPNPAFIINDLSEFGVDAELLLDKSSDTQIAQFVDRVADLHGIHSQEKLHASAGRALEKIADLKPAPSHVVCESTGTARPWVLIRAITQNKRFHLRHFIVTIDALNLHRDFADGHVFTGEVGLSDDIALHYAAEILAEQLLFANAIILTKTDTVPKEAIDAQVRVLNKIQPNAAIGLSSLEGFSLSHLDVTPVPNLANLKKIAEQFELTIDRPRGIQVETTVIHDPRPFHPQRLYDVFQKQLGTGIYRTKGFLWLVSRPSDVLLWQQSNSQVGFELVSTWAETDIKQYGKPPYDKIKRIRKAKVVHPIFGHRSNTLTLIGLPNACRIFAMALRKALCTDKEIIAWQRGEVFPDPWPQNHRLII